MSAIDRMRRYVRAVRGNQERGIPTSTRVDLDVDTVEALCVLADHARALIESGVPDEDGDAIAIRAALSRLDGEASR